MAASPLLGDNKPVKAEEDSDSDVKVVVQGSSAQTEEQEEPKKEDPDEIITLHTTPAARIVGIQHYAGLRGLRDGTELELRRDPHNIYDRNAIEVRLPNKGSKIGHLSKQFAARIASLMDAKLIETVCFAGPIPTNTVGVREISGSVSLIGPRSLLADSRLDWTNPHRAKLEAEKKKLENEMRSYPRSSAMSSSKSGSPADADPLLFESILVQRSERKDVIGELFKEGMSDPALLPLHPCPPGKKDKSMRSDLMPFQSQGIAWMIRMEHPRLPENVTDPPVQLWQKKEDSKGETFWFNVATELSQREKPVLRRGGILADEMGLGKTMQTIALICTDDTGEGVLPKPEEPDERFDDMTLIVCPLSVTSNWTDQFHHHVGSKRLKWHVYHGEGRELNRKQLRKFDVIITTYQTVALEHYASDARESDEPSLKKKKLDKPAEGTLHTIKWRRVVLDEGHVIKNPKAKMSKACTELKAERRWILTGTPIINSTTDLGAMMTFLRLCRPLDERHIWAQFVEKRAKLDAKDGAKLLRAIVSSTTLRRTKDMVDSNGQKLVTLPTINFYLHRVKLAPDAQALYDEVYAVVRDRVKSFVEKRSISQNYSDALVYLLRLRQLACDPQLCPSSFIEDARVQALANEHEAVAAGVRLPKQEVARLQAVLRRMTQEANAECSLCFDVPFEPRITACGHVFCAACIEEQIDRKHCCPLDSYQLTRDHLVESGPESAAEEDDAEVIAWQAKAGVDKLASAAKGQQLLLLLKATEPGIKSLVFSQWTTHLTCLEATLHKAGIVTCRFDGSMTQAKREAVIADFSESKKSRKADGSSSPTVMLISLKAGALGLNLTCASQVFLMDPWWQASIEQQAIDRVYRIGQTRPVKVFQVVAEGTVEDRVLAIQKRKEELISQAFSGSKNTGSKRNEKIESRLADIATIFGIESK
ncbi:hypothetical protein T439DRAFT_323492 [Meredithblackwellia eburnea MCA 4105]